MTELEKDDVNRLLRQAIAVGIDVSGNYSEPDDMKITDSLRDKIVRAGLVPDIRREKETT